MLCRQTNGVMHVDHIKPRSKYPHLALRESNLQVLCEACNLGKGNWDETDWRPLKRLFKELFKGIF
jgi:5-methylcytosine-specific restriction endonuclease McrA